MSSASHLFAFGHASNDLQTYAGSQITVYITLGFSKLASILLVRRLFIRDMKSAWAICNIITILVIVWTIVSAMLISVGCKLDSLSPKNPSDICSGLQARYLFVVITDAMTDLVLSFIPTYLCRHLQMDMNFKLQVLGIFALRLPVLALAGLFFKAWVDSTHSNNYGVDRTTSLIYQQCQLCCSLIAATVPCLKSFIQSFDTGSGQKAGFGSSSRSGTYGHMSSVRHSTVQVHEGEDYEMSRLDDNQRRKSRLGHLGSNQQAIRVNRKKSTDVDSVSEVTLGLRRTSTQESDRRSQQSTQELVIRKEVQFVVRHEPAKGTETHQPGQLRLPK